MRTTIASLMVFFTLAIGAGVAGCGDDDDAAVDPVTAGSQLASTLVCSSCHGTDYAGGDGKGGENVGPNITQSKTAGIGDWTDAQIGTAINTGVDDEGKTLCNNMARYALSAGNTSNLVAFLRTIKASENEPKNLTCPEQ